MKVFSVITPSYICCGPPSLSSTAPYGQTLLGFLHPSALIFYLDLSYHSLSCAWLGCSQPSLDAVFQDGRFPYSQKVLPLLSYEQSQGTLLMLYTQL